MTGSMSAIAVSEIMALLVITLNGYSLGDALSFGRTIQHEKSLRMLTLLFYGQKERPHPQT